MPLELGDCSMKGILILFLAIPMLVNAAETRFFLKGMTCPFCASSVEKAFKNVKGFEVKKVEIVSLETGEVVVHTKDKGLSRKIIERELKETSFSLDEAK